MYEPPQGYETVLRTKRRRECFESRLVLNSAGILSEAVHRDGWWWLIVGVDTLSVARDELAAYQQENLEQRKQPSVTIPLYGGAVFGVFAYAAVIILVELLAEAKSLGFDWPSTGHMNAGRVMGGELWRVVTALTLHVDFGHLASNLVFGAVFGLLAGRILGGGVAWLVIVLAGSLGNLMNAMVQASEHTSIGASTAVFAALGVLVAHALRPRANVQEKSFKRWAPLIAGVILLGYTGVGDERTDVLAHLTGFLAGLLLGWIGCRLPDDWLARPAIQKCSGAAAITVVTAAWIVGLLNA